MKGVVERAVAQVPAWKAEGLTSRYDRLVAEGREAQPPPGVPQSACRQARNLLRRLVRRKQEVLRFLSRFCRIRSYVSTARKQGRGVLAALEGACRGGPLNVRKRKG